MFTRVLLFLSILVCLVGTANTALADVPQLINYQGVLLDALGDPVTTPVNVIFAVWSADIDGDSLWSEEQSVTPDDQGRFAVLLGAVSPIPDSAFAGAETYLSVKVDTDPEMAPRQRFASVAYAYHGASADAALYADSTDAITDGGVDLADLGQNGAAENQIIKWDGSAWAAADDETGTGGDNDWTLTGDVLYTGDEWGIARAGNVLYGDHDSTHVNLGVACTTGTSGESYAYATVGGGSFNTASHEWATVAGGQYNIASSDYATIGGGYVDTASGVAATVGGGIWNTASGYFATIPGGRNNTAVGNYSFAAGRGAKAYDDGCFIWADGTGADYTSYSADEFRARASGGVYFHTNSALTTGVYVAAGGNSWNAISDRATKENFTPVDRQALLKRLAALPVNGYNIKSQDSSIRHIGPVAQDFFAAFGCGESDRAINMEDAHGVALAAIQGLYQQNQEQQKEIAELKALVKQLLEDKK